MYIGLHGRFPPPTGVTVVKSEEEMCKLQGRPKFCRMIRSYLDLILKLQRCMPGHFLSHPQMNFHKMNVKVSFLEKSLRAGNVFWEP